MKKKGREWACKPGSVPARRTCRAGDGHFSRRSIARRLQRAYPEVDNGPDQSVEPRRRKTPCDPCSLFDLAPGGVCLARPVTRPAGELLPHRFTLTCASRSRRGGLLSVALSLASRPVGVTHHRVLRSPDFPLVETPADRARPEKVPTSGRPAHSTTQLLTYPPGGSAASGPWLAAPVARPECRVKQHNRHGPFLRSAISVMIWGLL